MNTVATLCYNKRNWVAFMNLVAGVSGISTTTTETACVLRWYIVCNHLVVDMVNRIEEVGKNARPQRFIASLNKLRKVTAL